eukprot:symbB.v1.2.011562.t1/scaffold715.1/size233058/8
MLDQAAAKLFPKTDDTTCHRWAGAICEAIQFVRVKSQKLTSGKKQTPAVMEVAKVYLQQSRRSGYTLKNAGHFAQGSSKKRKLQREHSSPKKKLERQVSIASSDSAALPVTSGSNDRKHKLSILDTMPKLASDKPAVPMEISSGSESAVEAAPSKPAAVSGSYWVDESKMVLVRLKNGDLEEARTTVGPAGFAVARFGEEAAIDTEIPNTLLHSSKPKAAPKKRPSSNLKRPAAASKKRPAAASVEEQSSDAGADILSHAPPVQAESMDAPERLYKIDDYKVVANYKDLLLAILPLTLRPPKIMLDQAAAKLFPKTDDTTCHRWAGAICEAIQFVRVKSQKLTSGKKQTPAVMEVAKVYLQQSRRSGYTLKNAGHFAQGSSKKRKLQREHSSPKKKLERQVSIASSDSAALPVTSGSNDRKHKLSILDTMPKLASDKPAVPMEISSGSESAVEAAPSKPAAVSGSYWVDESKMVLVRLKNGDLEEARMTVGPAGFAVARFGEEAAIETEIPNTLLHSSKPKAAPKKRPSSNLKRPAAASKKTPAAASVEEQSSDAGADILSHAPPVQAESMDAPERLYKIEDYKVTASRKTATLALRRQFGDKKQIASFSLKSIPRETGLKVMQEALSKLHEGRTEAHCQDWLAKQHHRLSACDVD